MSLFRQVCQQQSRVKQTCIFNRWFAFALKVADRHKTHIAMAGQPFTIVIFHNPCPLIFSARQDSLRLFRFAWSQWQRAEQLNVKQRASDRIVREAESQTLEISIFSFFFQTSLGVLLSNRRFIRAVFLRWQHSFKVFRFSTTVCFITSGVFFFFLGVLLSPTQILRSVAR